MPTGVVLLAAGAGRRIGGPKPKQFLPLNGAPLFASSLRAFARVPSVKEIIVVCSSRHRRLVEKVARKITRKKVSIVEGGAYRGLSVRNGVRALSNGVNVILVHDTARPLVTPDIVRRVEAAAKKSGAALAAWPLPDTLKSVTKKFTVKKTIPRQGLWLAQTPQGFRRDVAIKCLLHPSRTATDDVELAQRKGFKVTVVEGDATNFKVTYPTDLKLCRLLAR